MYILTVIYTFKYRFFKKFMDEKDLRKSFSRVRQDIESLKEEIYLLKPKLSQESNMEDNKEQSNRKKALVTGITGQDGAYLAELLIKKGYEVYGLHRRTSMDVFDRIGHLRKEIKLVEGDVTDFGSIIRIIRVINPDEIYNLAAQSFVPDSWTQPISTVQINALGVINILEAIRILNPKIKFYQASTSEMFGKVQETPQKETTPFHPRSPYAASKAFGYYITQNYRESYNIFACNGILFNHECISENTPLIIREKKSNVISIVRVKDIRKPREKGSNIQQWILSNTEIWDGENFVDLNCMTATRRKKQEEDFHCKTINTKNGIIETTNHHNMFDENKDKLKSKEVKIGAKLLQSEFPKIEPISVLSKEEAMFLGMMIGDGYISEEGKGQFTNNNKEIRELIKKLWEKIALGSITERSYKTEYGNATQIKLNKNSSYLKAIKKEIYTQDGFKKIPDRILNADKEIKLSFLVGYNLTDGLKSNPCIYEFKNFKTNSILLAHGLIFLIKETTNQNYNISFEKREGRYGYYSINLLSPTTNLMKEKRIRELLNDKISQREICKQTRISRSFIRKVQNNNQIQICHHLAKLNNEVKNVFYHENQPEWVFDIETGSGKLMAGVGTIVISNSPKRGKQFVTRKITHSVAKIKLGYQEYFEIGNMDAKRDWGYAGDYVEAMWMMMQKDKSDNYVIGTGETHSVREFIEEAFKCVGMSVKWEGKGINEVGKCNGEIVVRVSPQFYRPAEVDYLLAEPSKARKVLGWKPKTKFKELVKMMINSDLEQLEKYGLQEKDKSRLDTH